MNNPNVIAGFSGDEVRLLEESEIVRIYAANQKVYAQTANREYILRRAEQSHNRICVKALCHQNQTSIRDLGGVQ